MEYAQHCNAWRLFLIKRRIAARDAVREPYVWAEDRKVRLRLAQNRQRFAKQTHKHCAALLASVRRLEVMEYERR